MIFLSNPDQSLALREIKDIACAILLCSFLMAPTSLYAAMNLSVNPSEGGNSLRFGPIDSASAVVSKEVRLRITSDEHQQYQVFQRVQNPLINEKGTILDQEAIKNYTLSGSNSLGTLYAQNETSLAYGEELLYTSNPNGDDDSFTVIYRIDKDQLSQGGNFLGKIIYTVRPIGGNSLQDAFLDIALDIAENKNFELESSGGKGVIRLGTGTSNDYQGFIKFSFSGNRGVIRIFQEMDTPPQNDLSEPIDPASINCVTTNKGGGFSGNLNEFIQKRSLVYSSQEENDSVAINFEIQKDKIVDAKAGSYQGQIRYVVESEQFSKIIPVNFLIDVSPIFNMEVDYPQGGVHFTGLIPGTTPQMKEINVRVFSNLGRPYMVTQNVQTRLTNQTGENIAPDLFSMKVELLKDNPGRIEFAGFSTVPEGSAPVFFSNNKGESSQFKVLYRLDPSLELKAGEYTAAFMYSLNEI